MYAKQITQLVSPASFSSDIVGRPADLEWTFLLYT